MHQLYMTHVLVDDKWFGLEEFTLGWIQVVDGGLALFSCSSSRSRLLLYGARVHVFLGLAGSHNLCVVEAVRTLYFSRKPKGPTRR